MPSRDSTAPARLKAQVLLACRILSEQRLVAAFGHVSARVPGTTRFVVSPRAGPGSTTAARLLVVDSQYGRTYGAARPPIELPIHTMIYRMRADVGAICRIHGEAASILSVLRQPVRPLHFLGSILGGEVPVHDFGDLITDGIRGEAVARTIGNLQAVLLRGNGQVVLGTTLIEACARAIYLEEAARMQIRAAALGRPRYYAPEETEAYARAWDDRMNVERVWRYYTWRVRRQSDAADRRNSLGRSRRASMKRRSQ